jgi:DNA invertase Pin-like site-specific DNA recombinase
VFENTESTKRQYGLRERAVALGWPADRVVVIDSDLGQSGAASDCEGFQKLVAAVGMGQVGVVLGLEVSRLARSSSDWHRLLAKAGRGELEIALPVGLVYGPDGSVTLDPDQQVRTAMRTLFDTFRRTGSASLTVRHFREHGLLIPRRLRVGPRKGELAWGPLRHSPILNALHKSTLCGSICVRADHQSQVGRRWNERAQGAP